MKKITIDRYKSSKPLILANGDKYDSTLALISEDGVILFYSELVNTDHTNSYRGGILNEGGYYGIVGYRNNGNRVIKLFSTGADITKIKTDKDINGCYMFLPSKVSNPNHNGKKIISYVQIHGGGLSWDYSHGCITLPNFSGFSEFDKLMKNINNNEILTVSLR